MRELDRDYRILTHIVSYCDQIDMAVEHFGQMKLSPLPDIWQRGWFYYIANLQPDHFTERHLCLWLTVHKAGDWSLSSPNHPAFSTKKSDVFLHPCHCFHEAAQLQYIALLQTGDGGYCTWNCLLIPFGTSMESCGGAARYGRSWLGW